MSRDVSAWTCGNGHVLGLARRNGSTVQQLLLYRQALDMEPGAEQMDVDVIAVISSATDIRCSVCGDIRTWFLDPEFMRRLVKKTRSESEERLRSELAAAKARIAALERKDDYDNVYTVNG